jgi:NAD(P)H-quinone oxidoreductase subunit 4L
MRISAPVQRIGPSHERIDHRLRDLIEDRANNGTEHAPGELVFQVQGNPAAAALIGIGLYGALSQQSFVMLMMGLELMLNGALLATIGFWSLALGGMPEGQLLAILVMAVMAIEMAIGFALIVAVYRKRQADMTESIGTLKQ